MTPSVFVSYNPNSETEQTLALRLHTIGAVHGFNMILPDRSLDTTIVSRETQSRILTSDFFILFSTVSLSSVVQKEINIAFSKYKDKSKILVIYDKVNGKNLDGAENCTEVYIDTREDALKIVSEIASKLRTNKPNSDSSFLSALAGILLIGVGLFAMTEMITQPRKPKKRPKTAISKKKAKSNA
jgi:hypothetical protein